LDFFRGKRFQAGLIAADRAARFALRKREKRFKKRQAEGNASAPPHPGPLGSLWNKTRGFSFHSRFFFVCAGLEKLPAFFCPLDENDFERRASPRRGGGEIILAQWAVKFGPRFRGPAEGTPCPVGPGRGAHTAGPTGGTFLIGGGRLARFAFKRRRNGASFAA